MCGNAYQAESKKYFYLYQKFLHFSGCQENTTFLLQQSGKNSSPIKVTSKDVEHGEQSSLLWQTKTARAVSLTESLNPIMKLAY